MTDDTMNTIEAIGTEELTDLVDTDTAVKKTGSKIWILPAVLAGVVLIGAGGYFGYSAYKQNQANVLASQMASSEQAELLMMRQSLDRDTFYTGVYIDDINLEDMTYDEAKAELESRDKAWREQFLTTLELDGQQFQLTAADVGMTSDWPAVLDEAWAVGRTSTQTDEERQIRERYALVEALKTTPNNLTVSHTYNEASIKAAIVALAGTLRVEPVNAVVTGFDINSKEFTFTEAIPGRVIDGDACAAEVLSYYEEGGSAPTVTLITKPVPAEIDSTVLRSRLGLISQATTYAEPNRLRNINIRLVCQTLNGFVLWPGETFSFNGIIGKRTAEKGYQMANGIINGVYQKTYGGGICQPNTTLFQAVVKADLLITERWAHTFKSSYTDPGLDATVSWPGADFKFKNNTEYPIAINCWIDTSVKGNPVVFKIYGRLFEPGVSIDFKATWSSTPAPTNVQYRYNVVDVAPGQSNVIRPAKTGYSATSYKIWMKDGVETKREFAYTSVYPALCKVIGYGSSEAEVNAPAATTPATTPAATTPAATTPPEPTTAATTATP